MVLLDVVLLDVVPVLLVTVVALTDVVEVLVATQFPKPSGHWYIAASANGTQ